MSRTKPTVSPFQLSAVADLGGVTARATSDASKTDEVRFMGARKSKRGASSLAHGLAALAALGCLDRGAGLATSGHSTGDNRCPAVARPTACMAPPIVSPMRSIELDRSATNMGVGLNGT